MFLLRDLPTRPELRALAARYPELDAGAAEAFLAFLRAACEVFHASEAHFARHRTSCGRFTVLALLNREPARPLAPSRIAAACGVTRATITGLLDGLEGDGLVRRERSGADRRAMQVRLTEAGRRFLDGMLPDHFCRIRRLMAGLGAADRAALRRIAGTIAASATALSDPEPPARIR